MYSFKSPPLSTNTPSGMGMKHLNKWIILFVDETSFLEKIKVAEFMHFVCFQEVSLFTFHVEHQ